MEMGYIFMTQRPYMRKTKAKAEETALLLLFFISKSQ